MAATMTHPPEQLDTLTVSQLRKMVRQQQLARGAAVVSATKADLIALLTGKRTSFNRPDLPAIEASTPAEAGNPDIDKLAHETRMRVIAREEIAAAKPKPVTLTAPDAVVTVPTGSHEAVETMAHKYLVGHRNLYLVGPAGTGKTTAARHFAEAIEAPRFAFLSLSAGVGEHHIAGRPMPQADGSWKHQPTPFIEVFRNGGVFLLDEIDAADPNVLVSINAALANGQFSNPFDPADVIERHPDAVIVAAANTYGTGADAQYVGRNPLDAATLDRFTLATVTVDYDRRLEHAIAHENLTTSAAAELLDWIESLRDAIKRHRLRRVASTRLVINAARELLAGGTLATVKAEYFQPWSEEERNRAEARDE